MRLSALVPSAAAAIALSLVGSFAAAATVTSVNGASYTNSWHKLGTSNGTSAITTDQPRSGNGSLRLATNASGHKATASYGGARGFWGTLAGNNLGTFGDLLSGSLGFEFYRDASSTVAAHLAPAFEIAFANGANLKWEPVYNGYGTITENQWYSVNLDRDSGLFYQYNGSVVTNGSAQLNLTLDGWLASTFGNDFTTSTVIRGISIQAGSGWTGSFVGYVDNVYFNAGSTQLSANFEDPNAPIPSPVPTPAAASAGLALLGALAAKRARRNAAR